ncbi:uncharacterized membrane protein YebE (DUF533 family) [Geodermatophilus bullaregiensis]|uniref:hypothetical protein n=1 Tax=Geodermatophilus bullaregiensis TaxID=1564160 RepID=UPI00195D8275|nr:hypothetical protein [Geodermatophilus bullaregiensis]MBM7808257.1 uncharacterized membrane protein YebE (DUF533 family) [Geodermatophilus bullaregiensis]
MGTGEETWIARLTPAPGTSVADLLAMPLGLDVWERHTDSLVVAAADGDLDELERRRLARVERVTTTAQYLAQERDRPPAGDEV